MSDHYFTTSFTPSSQRRARLCHLISSPRLNHTNVCTTKPLSLALAVLIRATSSVAVTPDYSSYPGNWGVTVWL